MMTLSKCSLFLGVCTLGFLTACNTEPDFSMLCGDWIISAPRASQQEKWDCSSDRISGVGFVIQAGDTVFSEQFHLSKLEGEPWTLNVQVPDQNGGAYIPFFLEYWSADSLLFQNLDHDFPKRIAYSKKHADSLHVRVDAGAGTEQGSRFTFAKATEGR